MIMVGEAGVAALTLFLDGKARGWLEEQGVCQVTLHYWININPQPFNRWCRIYSGFYFFISTLSTTF